MKAEEFDSIWKILEQSPIDQSDSGIITRRIDPDRSYDLFLAYEKPNNRRIFLIQVKKEFFSDLRILPEFKSFEIAKIEIPDTEQELITFGLILNDSDFSDFFSALCFDLYQTICRQKPASDLIHSIGKRLQMWKEFLDFFGYRGMSDGYQRGLYGELRFLRDYLIPLAGVNNAILSWKGPEKGNQDFQIAGIGIEVKTSIAKLDQKFTVANEQQLDDSGLKGLFVYFLSLREIDQKGETLPGIINQIREIIKSENGPVREFETRLIKSGYLNSQQSMYEKKSYSDREIYFFQVRDKFPRITEKELKKGVGDIRYSVNVSACMKYRVSPEKFSSIFLEMVHEYR